MIETTSFFLALLTYLIATASPGPAVLAIMSSSASHGRLAGLRLASGVMTGSLFWGLCAAFGMAAVLEQFAGIFYGLKIVGGLYLIWLAFKSWRTALHGTNTQLDLGKGTDQRFYWQGLAIHLTNPKAVISWIAIYTVGVSATASSVHVAALFFGCAVLGCCIFFGYAVLFSSIRAQRLYEAAKRPINVLLGAVFAGAGLKLIFDRG